MPQLSSCGRAKPCSSTSTSTLSPSIEVNTEDGHILAFGVGRYVYGMHRIEELARLVEDAGGALVAAHPYRRQLPFHLHHSGDWSQALERAPANPPYRHAQ